MRTPLTDIQTQSLASVLEASGCVFHWQAPLGALTWYKVGGHAQVMVHPQSIEQLAKLVQAFEGDALPWRVLGSGANLLVPEGEVPGATLKLDHEAFATLAIEDCGDYALVRVGAGYDLMKLKNRPSL